MGVLLLAAATLIAPAVAPAVASTTTPGAWARTVTSVMFEGTVSATNVPYACFMCPGFVPAHGHLLSFAEGRLWTGADFGHHDLVMRRSVNDGQT